MLLFVLIFISDQAQSSPDYTVLTVLDFLGTRFTATCRLVGRSVVEAQLLNSRTPESYT